MNNRPLVSIMIPTYNQADLLMKAIDSAIQQDYPNLEIVVSNDNSTDHTLQVLARYSSYPNVRVYTNEKNLGRVANYKHTLEHLAQGEWAINLDGDDYFTDPAYISYCINLINKHGEKIMFVQGGHTIQNTDGKLIERQHAPISHEYEVEDGSHFFLHYTFFSHLATLFNRKEAIKLDFYRYDILSTDIESFLRLALNGQVILTRRIAGVWLHHDDNASRKLNADTVERNMLRITGPYEYARAIEAFPTSVLETWKRRKVRSYLLQYLAVFFENRRRIPGYFRFVLKKYSLSDLAIVIPIALARASFQKLSKKRK